MSRDENRRNSPCPECGSSNVVPVLYGYPAPEAVEEAERGTIVLGACCVGPAILAPREIGRNTGLPRDTAPVSLRVGGALSPCG